jgi:hypothetical protein
LQLIYDERIHVTLTQKVQDNESFTDKAQLTHIVSLLPDRMKEQWCVKKIKMMKEEKTPSLGDLTKWLNESIDMLIEKCNMQDDIKNLQRLHTMNYSTWKEADDKKARAKEKRDQEAIDLPVSSEFILEDADPE